MKVCYKHAYAEAHLDSVNGSKNHVCCLTGSVYDWQAGTSSKGLTA